MAALTANTVITIREPEAYRIKASYPVAPSVHIYAGSFVGLTPAGHLRPHVPGLSKFIGIADEEFYASSATQGVASALGDDGEQGKLKCRVIVGGTFTFALTASNDDVGKQAQVFATDDGTLSLTGNADAFVGRILALDETSGYVIIKIKDPGEMPVSGQGCYWYALTGHEALEPTGATAGDGWLGPWEYETILGPGFVNNDEEDGGFEMEFDATAEVALVSLRTPNDIFPIDKGLRLSFDLNITDNGDAAAIDVDCGFGTALTTNSEANVDHADMVQLVALHVDGNSLNLYLQSDDNTTDVAPTTDSTIDYVEGTPIHVDICVSPAGLCRIYVDGVNAGDASHGNVTLQMLSTANVAAFINVEKTSDDTTFRAVVKNIVLTAGMVAS